MFVRIKFSKTGAIRYIGHLDVMRYFQKCIRRAELDVAYTGGFSPHQIMTFASPLGVGLESYGEYMDVKFVTDIPCEEIQSRLNAVSVPEIRILDVTRLPENAGNAMASVAAAEYRIEFREGRVPLCLTSDGLFSTSAAGKALAGFLEQEEILYEKETKKGSRTLNLKDGIFAFDVTEEEGGALHLLCDASSAGNIKPSQVMEALASFYGEELMEHALLVTRLELYTRDEQGKLIPMNRVGQDEETV